MENRLDVPDEDVLEEFEELGQLQGGSLEADEWKGFEHTSWDDADLDDRFVRELLNELTAQRERIAAAASTAGAGGAGA